MSARNLQAYGARPTYFADKGNGRVRGTPEKEQGATGITTVAPYVAGQWGRGNNRLLR